MGFIKRWLRDSVSKRAHRDIGVFLDGLKKVRNTPKPDARTRRA